MTTADTPGMGRRGMTWPQQLALAVGVIFTLIGIIGFFITGFDDFFGNHSGTSPAHMDTLLGFMINPVHNLVHLVVGIAGFVLCRTLREARLYGWLLAAGYGAAFVYGLFALDEDWDFLNLNQADNWLHLGSALVGLVIALGPVHTAAETGRDTTLRHRIHH